MTPLKGLTPGPDRGPGAYVAELIGTFALVFFITAAVSLYANPDPTLFTDFGVIGLVHVFVLFFLIQALAVASGAHFNPARSFGPAMADTNFGGAPDFLLVYVLAPVIGAVVAALAYAALYVAPGKKGEEGIGPVG